MTNQEDQTHIDAFERMGVTGVRALLENGQLTGRRRVLAGTWLDQKDAETRAKGEALQERGVVASEQATRIAGVALAVSILALLLSLWGIFEPSTPQTAPAPVNAAESQSGP